MKMGEFEIKYNSTLTHAHSANCTAKCKWTVCCLPNYSIWCKSKLLEMFPDNIKLHFLFLRAHQKCQQYG